MNCADINKQIYLYNELTEREQKETNEHLEACESCRRTMEQAIRLQRVVAVHQAQIPVLHNESMMTHRIMSSIAAKQRTRSSVWAGVVSSLKLSPLRYAMAALSVFLVSLFVIESTDQGDILRRQETYGAIPGPKTVLDLASFHNTFLKKRETQKRSTTVFANCIAECLQNDSGCEECTNKFMKP